VFRAVDLNSKLKGGQYKQKVDDFMVILDASGTMYDSYKGQKKLDLAKSIMSRMNQTIPDLKLNGALRTLGQKFSSGSALVYGLTDYSEFEKALLPVTGGGMTPLGLAINAANKDLEPARGNIAVIIVSDGKETDNASLKAAEKMKSDYGERVCIYTVLIGDDPTGKNLMEQVARAGQCGFSVNADDIMSSEGMGGFVEKVFLEKVVVQPPKPADSDGDGVYDDKDQCPNTPKGVKVDNVGCPLDTDGDGVYDYLDKCPGTPRGVKVDNVGCPLDTDGDGVYDYIDECPGTPKGAKVDSRGCWVIRGIEFDTNKSDIKPLYYPLLNEVAVVLEENPHLKVEIQGHTDSRGSAKYNQRLSEKRARAVMEYFVKKGINKERLTAIGYGLTRSIATNLTSEGRARNRRVELSPIY
jgi:OOP family OmpA-OmpF porin